YRAAIDKKAPPKRFIFESPVLRLASDFGYGDVYEQGADIMDADWKPRSGSQGISARSIVVYRYYDSGSTLFGEGKASPIEDYARGLDRLVLRVRELVCEQEGCAPADFRCYLVAHSMGGLVVRAFLQNVALGSPEARKAVDKVFTYATPHNGIETLGLNVPGWLSASDMNNFNRKRMAGYLALEAAYAKYDRVDYLPERALPIARMFCMVGSNRGDYDVALGLSRTFAGNGSDGLVKIANASVWGLDDAGNVTHPAATAYCYRSHSGTYGIVNSEEAYQNLTRFLFGDVRVEIWLEVDAVHLPAALQADADDVDALYQFELMARPRGKRWQLSRRISEEDSPACRTHRQLSSADAGARRIYLSTVFLANRARISSNPDDRTLSYSMDLRVRVPDYERKRAFWPDQHYEGSFLFRDSLIVTLEPPAAASGAWTVQYGWESNQVGLATQTQDYDTLQGGAMRLEIGFGSAAARPGIAGKVVLIASAWNVAGQ
ncbi:MAG TPA: hypothetical protein PL196_07280, partial [Burkholderiaceae bacterium]|nr:hypothetical protein [Burkholderiaceae bacterium]